jgi:hypothetical protein
MNKSIFDNLTSKKKEKKTRGRRERADNESFSLSLAPMAKKETYLGDGLVLELTGSLGELRELGSL